MKNTKKPFFILIMMFLIYCENEKHIEDLNKNEKQPLQSSKKKESPIEMSNTTTVETTIEQQTPAPTNFNQDHKYTMNVVDVDGSGKHISNKSDIKKISILKKEKNKNTKLKWKEVLELWKNRNKDFMDFYISILKNAEFDAYYLECVPLVNEGNNDFEFVLLKTEFNLKADGRAFKSYKNMTTSGNVISFDNLSKEARLVVPTNKNLYEDTFAHIANFSKKASNEQQYKLWQLTSEEISKYLKNNKKVFVSTHGKGVTWLHIRIEDYAKYFAYSPYK